MQHILDSLNAVPASSWAALLSLLGGSALVASVLQVIKHYFGLHDAKKFVTFLLGFLSFVAAFVDLIISTTSQSPQVLGAHTAEIMAIAVVVHRFIVSPIFSKIILFLNSVAGYRASLKPAPVAQVSMPAVDETVSFQP